MKRYLLFSWEDTLAQGGWDDLYESYNSLEEIKNDNENCNRNYFSYQIVDTKTGEEILYFGSSNSFRKWKNEK